MLQNILQVRKPNRDYIWISAIVISPNACGYVIAPHITLNS